MSKNKTLKEMKARGLTEFVLNDRLYTPQSIISLRGRSFKGKVIRKFPKRITIEFERTLYIKKYERYAKRKTKLHARLPENLYSDVRIGDYVEIKECRPISKITHFVVIKKISGEAEK